uniref:Uncharacterized protein n=1 Tax=Megaselia scalaris TaxID=36166 RepID=T1GV00_MEGSC
MQEKKDQEKENNREKTVPEENNNVILDLEDDFIEDCYEDYLKESLPEENYEEIIIHPPFD